MTPSAWIAIFGILLTMVLSMIAAVFWAGKVTAKLDILMTGMQSVNGKMDSFEKTCFTKAEAGIKLNDAGKEHEAMWKKLDKMKKAIIRLMVKAGFDITEEAI